MTRFSNCYELDYLFVRERPGFFCGVGCLLGALAISLRRSRGLLKVATILALFGMVLVVLSGTPLPMWFYAIALALTVAWLITTRLLSTGSRAKRLGLPVFVAVIWLGGTAAELPYHVLPVVKAGGSPRLHLVGDSISAGANDQTNTWPQLLARSHSVEVSDFSLAGATVGQMLRRAIEISLGDGIVLLEIGGNDLLGTTTSEDFATNLEKLLKLVCQPKRQVLMFELPLPPLRNEYGRIQRRLAARYHILLIPKRVFVAVLTGGGSTIDSVHLSPTGHQRMAEVVWTIIRPAYETRMVVPGVAPTLVGCATPRGWHCTQKLVAFAEQRAQNRPLAPLSQAQTQLKDPAWTESR